MRMARWGWPPLLVVALFIGVAVILLPAGPARWTGVTVGAVISLAMALFFRDPERTPQAGPDHLIAPADGVIDDVTWVEDCDRLHTTCLRVGIFMSVFDVHVNRMPIAGLVHAIQHVPGRHRDARHALASIGNAACDLLVEVAPPPAIDPFWLRIRQITGLIATRVVCACHPGQRLGQGERFGMIRFGSRVEVWIPASAPVTVLARRGMRVRAGETPIGRLRATGTVFVPD